MDRQARRLVNKREKDDRYEELWNFNNPLRKMGMKKDETEVWDRYRDGQREN